MAVRWYCLYPLSYRDVRDLLVCRSVHVDASTMTRWVVKFGPEIAKRSHKHRGSRGLCWHEDETCIRAGGKWRYIWRAVDQIGQMIDFRLTARQNMNAARAFFRQNRVTIHIYASVVTPADKAPTYPRIISEMNEFSIPDDEITHISQKGKNNRIESGHASLKRIIDPDRGFQTLRTVKAKLKGVEVHRMIKRGYCYGSQQGITA